ncbi:unnamed protein product [Owenia fusiformis]|uniref:Uncharacterized protein n=1 Tax=Owenia fusiformis TaxID=6347 RepID=A0A8J1T7B1_OWEFU|nr:unnamed protein product [Owenia fusiformis]
MHMLHPFGSGPSGRGGDMFGRGRRGMGNFMSYFKSGIGNFSRNRQHHHHDYHHNRSSADSPNLKKRESILLDELESIAPSYVDPFDIDYHDCESSGCQRVIINVSGQRFETQLRTLGRYPQSLLGDPEKRHHFWDSRRHEYFLDHHRPTFQAILYFYQSGGWLRKPFEVPEDVWMDELEFYELPNDVIENYKRGEGYQVEEEVLPEIGWKRNIFLVFEDPNSSLMAKIVGTISVVIIVISIIAFCVETLPQFKDGLCVNVTIDGELKGLPDYTNPFFIVETICVFWFTIELIMRFISCPSKIDFAKNILNAFDLIAILPYFMTIATLVTMDSCDQASGNKSVLFLRVLRVFRVFKLSKHSAGLRILGLTIKASLRELGMFLFFLIVSMVLFSAAVYYAEFMNPDSQFPSIPHGFWWAVVTMTTVGYGDVVPLGVWGKLIGSVCVISGVLALSLPVPVIVANFSTFYSHTRNK